MVPAMQASTLPLTVEDHLLMDSHPKQCLLGSFVHLQLFRIVDKFLRLFDDRRLKCDHFLQPFIRLTTFRAARQINSFVFFIQRGTAVDSPAEPWYAFGRVFGTKVRRFGTSTNIGTIGEHEGLEDWVYWIWGTGQPMAGSQFRVLRTN